MPRDARLYMTFPIDFDEHPKIELLSDAAFRAFVAMNGYCRRQRLDGKIPAAIATKRWNRKVLTELLASHDERPLLLLDADTYILRSYADHQFTTEDEEALRSARAIAGAKGGKAKAKALAIASQVQEQTPLQNVARSGIGIDNTDLGASSYVPDSPTGHDDVPRFPNPPKGGTNLNRIDAALVKFCGRTATEPQLHAIVSEIIARASGPVTSMTSFIVKAIENDAGEWQAFIDRGEAA